MKEYYDARAGEYDDWWNGTGLFADRRRDGWHDAVASLTESLRQLPPARTLDVACGSGFLTRHLPGEITALDQSTRMLSLARARLPDARLVHSDADPLPFDHDAFERVFSSHFYGHLESPDRERFLEESARVARELILVDAATRPDHAAAELQARVLNDGSRYEVFKRYFDALELTRELQAADSPWTSAEPLHTSAWFVVVRAQRREDQA